MNVGNLTKKNDRQGSFMPEQNAGVLLRNHHAI